MFGICKEFYNFLMTGETPCVRQVLRDPSLQFYLGSMYYAQRGVDEDYKEAVKWFRKATVQGHPEAQNYVDQIEFIGEKAPDFTLQTLTGERFNSGG